MRSGERTQKKSEREQRGDRAGSKRLTDSGQTGLLCRPKPEVAWKFLITLIHCAPNQTGFSQPPGFYLTLCFVIDFFFLPPFIFKAGYEHRGVRLHCLWMENFPEDCSYSLGLLPPVLLGEVHMTSRVCQVGFPAENEEAGDTSGPRDQKEEGSWQNMFWKTAKKKKSEKNAAGKTAQLSAGSEEDVSATSLTWKHLLQCRDTCGTYVGEDEKRAAARKWREKFARQSQQWMS